MRENHGLWDNLRMGLLLEILMVGTGGFLGASGRYLTGKMVNHLIPAAQLPWGTIAVNIIGCFVIGFITGLYIFKEGMNPYLKLFVLVGILGGYTTFSAFSMETLELLKNGYTLRATLNLGVTFCLTLAAVGIGFYVASIK